MQLMVDDDDFLDDIDASDESIEQNAEVEVDDFSLQKELEQAQKNLLARKRIDELKEKKRLKELLDDSDDW